MPSEAQQRSTARRRFRGVLLGIADAAVRLGDLWVEWPLVLETGSRSCPIYRGGNASTGSLEADAADIWAFGHLSDGETRQYGLNIRNAKP